MIFLISSLSVVISPFSFLILLIWILSLCPLVSPAKGLSILLIFSKNQLLDSLILYMVHFVSTWLISALSLMISCLLLLLGELASFCSRAFRCVVKLLVYARSIFFLEALKAMSFPHRSHGISLIFLYLLRTDCLVNNYMVDFGEGTMRCWEKGIFFCFSVKCSININQVQLAQSFN